jgi:RNA polymerase sigma-70 factor, ECF subfamily
VLTKDDSAQIVAALYDSHYSSLVRYAWRAAGTVDAAEELVQEAFLQLHQALRSGREVRNPAAWTFIAVRNAIYRRIREHRDRPVELQPADVLDSYPAPVPQADAHPDELGHLFQLLSRREEEVLLLRLTSLKYEEIAAELGIGAKAVSTLLSRAVQKLRRALERPEQKKVAEQKDVRAKSTRRPLQ